MKKDFTKKDLQTGDVIMLRNRELGVVFAEKEAIMYQNAGIDFYDAFNDDLTDAEADESAPYSELDIMEVRRSWNDSVVNFLDPEDSKCVYRRNDSVGYVEKKKQEDKPLTAKKCSAAVPATPAKHPDSITILSQAFYGNRTLTDIYVDKMDSFILGHLDDSFDFKEPIDRTIIQIPGTDNLVLVYNKYSEQRALEDKERYFRENNYTLKPLATIPELNMELYSRCILVRMKEDGTFASLEKGDIMKADKYLSW